MSATALRATLRNVLSRAHETVAALADHLEVTGAALARSDASNLETYLHHEMALLAKLDTTFREQHELLRGLGLTADRHGLEAAIARCEDPELVASWSNLRERLQHCRERNRSNARLAKQSSNRARTALGILRGDSAEATAYGPRGDVQSSAGSQSIGRA